MSLFDINKVISSQLDSRRLSHRETFIEKVEEYLQAINLPSTIDWYCNENAISEILELIDQQILEVLNKARKAVEGPRRGVPFLQKKCISQAKVQY